MPCPEHLEWSRFRKPVLQVSYAAAYQCRYSWSRPVQASESALGIFSNKRCNCDVMEIDRTTTFENGVCGVCPQDGVDNVENCGAGAPSPNLTQCLVSHHTSQKLDHNLFGIPSGKPHPLNKQ